MSKTNTISSADGKITISAEEFDRRFEAGEDISMFMDMSTVRRPGRQMQRVNVDFPKEFLDEIDREARRIGVSRQAWIKSSLAAVLKRPA